MLFEGGSVAGGLEAGGPSGLTTLESLRAQNTEAIPFLSVLSGPDVDAPTARPAESPATEPGAVAAGWMRRYQRTLVITDAAFALAAAVLAFGLRFGDGASSAMLYGLLVALLPLVWIGAASLNRAYDAAFVGNGATEYQRVYWTFVHLVAGVAIVSYAFKADLARGFVLVALPLTFVFVMVSRFVQRKRLHRRRARGFAMSEVIVIGAPQRAAELARTLRLDTTAGLKVVGACLPDERWTETDEVSELESLGIPVLGQVDDIQDIVRLLGATTVVVTSPEEIGPERLRWISWQLETTNAELIVAPGLIEVVGTRISVRPVSGLPLLHVDAPRFSGPHRLLKGAFDRLVAGTALLLLAPILLTIAAIVRLTSPGSALFRQTRIGRNGEPFTMFKFRSMSLDAEDRLEELRLAEESDSILFKMRNDPRVTSIGRVLRRFSLDELPQLINVVAGHMSLVGPRPPLPSEAIQYGDDARRRLLVKPGLTGLWQVSGRSDLSWEDSVRLDLRYVENWSLTLDMVVLWKTVRAVLRAEGAY